MDLLSDGKLTCEHKSRRYHGNAGPTCCLLTGILCEQVKQCSRQSNARRIEAEMSLVEFILTGGGVWGVQLVQDRTGPSTLPPGTSHNKNTCLCGSGPEVPEATH